MCFVFLSQSPSLSWITDNLCDGEEGNATVLFAALCSHGVSGVCKVRQYLYHTFIDTQQAIGNSVASSTATYGFKVHVIVCESVMPAPGSSVGMIEKQI